MRIMPTIFPVSSPQAVIPPISIIAELNKEFPAI